MSRSIALIALLSCGFVAACATDSPGTSGRPYRERRTYDESTTNRVLPETAAVYMADEVATPPRARVRRPPVYPFKLRRARIQGEAVISFVVNENGMVANARVKRASHPAFGEAALACVRSWVFAPAIRDGRPVNVQMELPIRFTLANR